MKTNKLWWPAFGLLALMLVAIGCFFVPSHWASIWNDFEFTDWVSPIANRLHGQSRLYAQGLHIPMPPLPFVLLRLLFPQGAIWHDESLVNFVFQAATLLLLFHAFSRELGVTVAFACALATFPVFFSLSKLILYDSMAQFFVAAGGVCAARIVRPNRDAGGPFRPNLSLLALQGLLLVLGVLSKQSTGAGLVLGVGLVLFFLPRSASFQARCVNTAATMLFAGLFFCLIGALLHPWVDFMGMIRDVLLTGSEPKGGSLHLLTNFVRYALNIGITTAALYCCFFIFYSFFAGRLPRLTYGTPFDGRPAGPAAEGTPAPPWGIRFLLTAFLASVAGFLVLLIFIKTKKPFLEPLVEINWVNLLLAVGLVPSFVFTGQVVFRKLARSGNDLGAHPLAPYAVVFLVGALFHNLSAPFLRLTVDNNPLIFLDFVFVIGACAFAVPAAVASARTAAWLRAGLVLFAVASAWPMAKPTVTGALACTETWPEIGFLAGARLRPNADGMRSLVKEVRSLVSDPDDTVLLLPGDPNVEAWFDRKRPELSCAIIFTDQYWDRYVEPDFVALQKDPPKLIIIGPRNYWRTFSRFWNQNRGAERLIDLVKTRLLPDTYELRDEHPIIYQGRNEFMDVYVRRGPK